MFGIGKKEEPKTYTFNVGTGKMLILTSDNVTHEIHIQGGQYYNPYRILSARERFQEILTSKLDYIRINEDLAVFRNNIKLVTFVDVDKDFKLVIKH